MLSPCGGCGDPVAYGYVAGHPALARQNYVRADAGASRYARLGDYECVVSDHDVVSYLDEVAIFSPSRSGALSAACRWCIAPITTGRYR
jgi:hypothetical protein